MSWLVYALISILFIGVSDIFRKVASGFGSALFVNLIFQFASFCTAVILFLLLDRKVTVGSNLIFAAFAGGILISLFSLFSFKSLSTGPSVSVVMPFLRVGGVVLVAFLGILFLGDKVSLHKIFGIFLAVTGLIILSV